MTEPQPIEVELVTDDDRSVATRERLLTLLDEQDVSPWIFTRRVVIDANTIPRSHPVLTLHTRHLGQDDLLLATFLHEQLHWFLVELPDAQVDGALTELRDLFPDVPLGFPEGAKDEDSTYLHLIVNYLELLLLRRVLGADKARRVIEHWSTDHYCWVYRTVLDCEDGIGSVVARRGLLPPDVT